MISITCTHCSATLTMDEAFAGGVCRCQHCGTIQTVPAMGKEKAGATSQQKALYQRRGRAAADAQGSGLDELADIVASSGLSGSGLSSGRLARPATVPAAKLAGESAERDPQLMPLLIGGGAVIAVLLGIILWLILRGGTPPAGSANAGTREQPRPASPGNPSANAPAFGTIRLDVPSVIYVLDRGMSTQSVLGHIKEATYRSIQSLGPDRKFQIIFWDNGSGPEAFPPLMSFVGKDQLAAAQRGIDDVYAFGQSDARTALELAMKQHPAAVVLITGKGWGLDADFEKMVDEVRKASPQTKIHTVSVGPAGQSEPLQRVARNTAGQYLELSEAQLHDLAQ